MGVEVVADFKYKLYYRPLLFCIYDSKIALYIHVIVSYVIHECL